MSEDLQRIERKRPQYFIVRYPTGNTAEILGKGGHWLSPFNDKTLFRNNDYYDFAQREAKRYGGKVISLTELEALCDTLNKLEKLAEDKP